MKATSLSGMGTATCIKMSGGRSWQLAKPALSVLEFPFWSNPSVNYNGVPAGTRDYEDEADVINDTAPIIAGFQ